MDQDSFRQLLSKPGASASKSAAAALQAPSNTKKAKTKKADGTQPAFKPRTVKKDVYRNRAAERREGQPNDYAQVEALAEDFEKRNADKTREELEEQRRYLGGDSEHTVLVKGLDFALLEQAKARVAAGTEDDDTLEQAFIEGSSTAPKKRTREEIVAELKSKRAKTEDGTANGALAATDASLDEAKKAGKFKPIGFKPIGNNEIKGKKKVVKRVKKKKAEVPAGEDVAQKAMELEQRPQDTEVAEEKLSAPKEPGNPEIEPLDEDFDIFAGAAEYIGLDLDEDDEDEGKDEHERGEVEDAELQPTKRWFDEDDAKPTPVGLPEEGEIVHPQTPLDMPHHAQEDGMHEAEEGEEQESAPARLAPLQSSTIPSIRDLLAMDDEEEKREKRKAKKEKRKGPLTSAAKVDRDYQRLKAFTDKKSAS